MKQDKFIVINLIKKLIVHIDKYLDAFPKKEIEIKKEIKSSSLEMLELAYEANVSEQMDKKQDIQEKIMSKILYIDFLINLCYDKQIINGKKYLKFGEDLSYLAKYVNGWKKYIKENRAQL